ncbi:hypothetical protein Pmani_025043 [Petrolisthes manimaculis]|uniref:Uncharacterized protein n=1 Tax=Petrolisthes manimaculis TaxID=1843537 RepID=A0AAE1TZC5_9EUCA|nr:hypothetical protein Pmani_025043 [Petrolisthes manimaculis]
MASTCGVGGAMWGGPRPGGVWATTGVGVVVLGVEQQQDLTTLTTSTNTPPPSSSPLTDHDHVSQDWSSVVSRETERQSPSPRSVLDLGQQLGEYMRRISDYVYWVVTGTPPTNRKRNRPEYRQREKRPMNDEGPSTQPPTTNHKRHNQLEYTWVFHTNHENHQRKRRPPVSDGLSIDYPTNYKRNNEYENHQRERRPLTSEESTKRRQRPRHRDRGGVALGPNHVKELVQTRLHRNTRQSPIIRSQQVRDSLPTR